MFDGTADYVIRLREKSLTFPFLEFNPGVQHVNKISLDGLPQDEIIAKVHVQNVNTREDGRILAEKAINNTANRLAYYYDLSIEHIRKTGEGFVNLDAPSGTHEISAGLFLTVGGSVLFSIGKQPGDIIQSMEKPTLPGEHNFSFYRAAKQSMSPIEEYMHLYNILLMIFNDEQVDVDIFLASQEPSVPQTQHPKKKPGKMETIYTKLRNEFSHKRSNVDLDKTKDEMRNRVGSLRQLTKKAIELHP